MPGTPTWPSWRTGCRHRTAAARPGGWCRSTTAAACPTAAGSLLLCHPVELDGSEVEGGAGTPTVDSSQTIAVDFLGSVPSAGDLAVAFAVGGRWVAERGVGGGVATVPCSPCPIPEQDLTISWTNLISGPGSATLTYSAFPSIWKTKGPLGDGCVNGMIYELLCSEGQLELVITYFISGSCPTGQSNSCSNLEVYPFGLVLSSHTCSPFSLTFTVAPGCPEVEAPGFTSYTITL